MPSEKSNKRMSIIQPRLDWAICGRRTDGEHFIYLTVSEHDLPVEKLVCRSGSKLELDMEEQTAAK